LPQRHALRRLRRQARVRYKSRANVLNGMHSFAESLRLPVLRTEKPTSPNPLLHKERASFASLPLLHTERARERGVRRTRGAKGRSRRRPYVTPSIPEATPRVPQAEPLHAQGATGCAPTAKEFIPLKRHQRSSALRLIRIRPATPKQELCVSCRIEGH